tara:strand:- start:229 stop:348 length:120 start_codon:yes stop_codon:yes gene_type:complete
MSEERFRILMKHLYSNNQLFIPQNQLIDEWIDNTLEKNK